MSAHGHLTQFKLDEARFFLDHLAPNYGKERKFDFFLSAFISAARSVTWVMKAEYADVEGWAAWFHLVRLRRRKPPYSKAPRTFATEHRRAAHSKP